MKLSFQRDEKVSFHSFMSQTYLRFLSVAEVKMIGATVVL